MSRMDSRKWFRILTQEQHDYELRRLCDPLEQAQHLREDMRKVQILTVEEKVGKLSAKMSVPLILFIMFPIVILILAPSIMQMTLNI